MLTMWKDPSTSGVACLVGPFWSNLDVPGPSGEPSVLQQRHENTNGPGFCNCRSSAMWGHTQCYQSSSFHWRTSGVARGTPMGSCANPLHDESRVKVLQPA